MGIVVRWTYVSL